MTRYDKIYLQINGKAVQKERKKTSKTRTCQKRMRNWVKVMWGRQLEALASAKAGEAAAAYYSASVTNTRVGKTAFLTLCKLYFSQLIKCISVTSSTVFV